MKKSIKKLLSLFLAFSIVLGNLLSVFPASDSEESTNTTLKVDMRVINLEGDGTINEETDFWVDKTINSAADISVSGTGSKITNPWIVVTVPKVSIINKPTFIDSQNAYQSLKLEDDSNYYILYKFNEITGGMRSTFPFPFKFDKVQAKNGDTVTVKMDMLDANTVDDKVSTDSGKMISLIGSLPKLYSVQKTYKAIKDDLEISISMAFIDKGNQTIADSTPSSTGKDRTVSDIHNAIVNINSPDVTSTTNEKVPIRFSYGIDTSKITGTTITHRPVEQIVTTVKVPDGATLSEASIKAGWVYNEQDRTATKIQNNPRIESSSWYYYYGARVTDLELLFSVPFNTVHEIPVELKYKYEGEEEKTLPELTLRIQFTPRVFTPGHSFRVFKDNLTNYGTTADGVKYWISEGKYVYYGDRLYDKTFDHTDVGLFYTINVDNNNNGSSTTSLENGIVSNIFKIEDVLSRTNEHKIYYDTFSIADIYKNNGNLSNDAYIKKSEQLKNQINSIPNVLYGITDSGEKIKIAENIKYQKKVNINDTSKRFAKLSLEFSEPLTLDNIGLSLYSLAKPTEEELENFKNGNYLSRQYYYGLANAYQNSAINPSSDINSANYVTDVYHFGETSIGTIDPRAHLANSLDKTTVPYVASGTYLMYSTDAYLRADYGIWGPLANKEIKDAKVIQLLPPGFNFVEKLPLWHYQSNIDQPLVVQNYKNTGRTAVIYNIPKFIPSNSGFYKIGIPTKIEATQYAERGNNVIESFFVFDNNNVISPYYDSTKYTDELDLDGDGDRNETFLRVSSTINYIPPLELLVKKTVGIDKNIMGLISTADLGYEFLYGINIFNNTIADAYNAYVVDVLPYVGDHSIVPNQNLEYTQRESKFPVYLSGAIEDIPENQTSLDKNGNKFIDRFDIFYQLSPQGDDLESVRDGVWVTKDQVSDFSKVKSFKIQLKDGQKIESKEEVKLFIKAKLPYDTSLKPEEDFAVNSTAISTDNSIFSEGNSVKTTFTTYSVSGIVFNDINKNGTKDSSESLVPDTIVEIVDADTGNVALDYNGNTIPSVKTDSEGKYNFDIYKRGNYKVRFTLPNGKVFSTSNGNGVNDNNVIVTEENISVPAETTTFNLSPSSNTAIKNAAIYEEKRDVNILKMSDTIGIDGDYKKLTGAEFKLVLSTETDGSSNVDDGTQKEFVSVDLGDGKYTLKDVPFGEYKLIETKSPSGYRISDELKEGIDVTVGTEDLSVIELKNSPNKGSIKIAKVDRLTGDLLIGGTTFELYVKNEATNENNDTVISWNPVNDEQGNIRTATTDSNGIAIFDNLLAGIYRLVEKVSNIAYVLPVGDEANTDVSFVPENDGFVSNTTITNSKKTGTVRLRKVDSETNEPIKGVKFEIKQTMEDGTTSEVYLYTENKEKAIATTNDDGVAEFTNVPFGSNYSIYEIEAPTKYVKLDGKINFETTVDGVTTTTDAFSISENGQTVEVGDVKNQLKKADVIITKKGENSLGNEDVFLAGVKFELRKDGVKFAEATTDESGKITFANVPYGDYTLVETETLENYVLNSDPIQVNVRKDGEKLNFDVTNNLKKGRIIFKKVNASDTTKGIEGVKFALKQGDNIVYTATSNNLGNVEFDNVTYGEYELVETEAADGYVKSEQKQKVNITSDNQVINLGFIKNSKLIDIKGKKIWEDYNNKFSTRPSEITLALKKNGEELKTIKLSGESNVWEFEFNDLPEYSISEAGDISKIKYEVIEKDVVVSDSANDVDGSYKVSYSGSTDTEIDITNTFVNEKTIDISGIKTWNDDDDRDGKRPSEITVNLLADGKQIDSKNVNVNVEGEWKYSFGSLLKYNKNGDEIKYTVTENTVPEYTTGITNFDIDNSYTPGKTSVTVTKNWDDDNNRDGIRPSSIEVELVSNGNVVNDSRVVLSAENSWSYTWDNLNLKEKTDGTSSEIKYTVREVGSVDGYKSSINDEDHGNIIITNTHIPATTSLSGNKIWEDAENQDGIRPEKIVFSLYADGEVVENKIAELNDGETKFEFTDLPKYKVGAVGQLVDYSIIEKAVNGYNATYKKNDDGSITTTNTHIPEKTSFTAYKVWEDAKNQDGVRPKEVKIKLVVDGEVSSEEVVLNEANKWTHTWENLDKNKKGKEIKYSVIESPVEKYEVSYNAINSNTVEIKNVHIPELTNIQGKKSWLDNDNKSGNRPKSITVRLLADNIEVASKTVSSEDNWNFKFDNMPKYKDGKLINYSISEDFVTYYTPEYDGTNITNKYTPDQTYITVRKVWNDENDYDKLRPESIKVSLLANGKATGKTVELNSKNDWTYQFVGLDLKLNKKNVVYSVIEKEVPKSYSVNYEYSDDKKEVKIVNTHKVERVIPNKIIQTNNNVTNTTTNNTTNNNTVNNNEINKNSTLPQTGNSDTTSLFGGILGVISLVMIFKRKREY